MSEFNDFNRELQRHFEQETIEFFAAYHRDLAGPQYVHLEFLDPPAPDARLTTKGGTQVGVEETRAVDPDDARLESWTYYLGGAIQELLAQHAAGGHVYITGAFPQLAVQERRQLVGSLADALEAAGGVDHLTSWEHGGAYFDIEVNENRDGWALLGNGIQRPHRPELPEHRLTQLLQAAVTKKQVKAADYEWHDTLILLVRNPYQPYLPAPQVLREVKRQCQGVFDEVWLVNRKQGAIDPRPPGPRLVRLDGQPE